MTVIQFFILGLAMFMIIKTASDFRKNKVSPTVFILWEVVWLSIIAVAVLPQITGILDKLLSGKDRGLQAMTYLSIFFIFFVIFKIIAKLERIEKQITEIVRHLALRNPEKK